MLERHRGPLRTRGPAWCRPDPSMARLSTKPAPKRPYRPPKSIAVVTPRHSFPTALSAPDSSPLSSHGDRAANSALCIVTIVRPRHDVPTRARSEDTALVSSGGVVALVVVVVLAVAFDVTNGFHDSSNSIAAPVATRAMRPATAVAVAAVFTILGPILAGTAVADTVGGLISVGTANTLGILFASLLAAVMWNLATWWWGLPSSSSHACWSGSRGGRCRGRWSRRRALGRVRRVAPGGGSRSPGRTRHLPSRGRACRLVGRVRGWTVAAARSTTRDPLDPAR